MSNARIKVKAMGLFVAGGRILLTPSFDSVKQKAYYRLLGGHVEFGERAEETLKREMQEELATEIEVGELLDVVQNIFQYEGRDYHEIVFIHHAWFLDDAITRKEDLHNLEPGQNEYFRWMPLDEVLSGTDPVFPAADFNAFLARIGVARKS